MEIAVSAGEGDLDAQISPSFGRCPFFVFVEAGEWAFEAAPNPGVGTLRGAGIQAAQFIADQGAKVILTGSIGPNAYATLQTAGITIFAVSAGTVRSAVQAYRAAHLSPVTEPTARPSAGLGAQRPRPSRRRGHREK